MRRRFNAMAPCAILVRMDATRPSAPGSDRGQHLMLYDGVCGLCNRANQFILRHDRRRVFDLASLQSATSRGLLSRFQRSPDRLDTFYVVVDYRGDVPRLLSKARAALFVLRELGRPWSWFAVLGAIPDAVLDRIYDLIARHRYRLFGRYETCPLPSPEQRQRFIDV